MPKRSLKGRNPYLLARPAKSYDWPYPMILPGTALVAVAPLTLFPVKAAALLFVAMSSFALTFGITRKGWHLLPMLASAAFFDSVFAAQWSMLMTAALFLPALAALACVKPQIGIPVVASAPTRATWLYALVGGLALLAVSLVLLPSWPSEWTSLVMGVAHMRAPLLSFPGLLLLALVVQLAPMGIMVAAVGGSDAADHDVVQCADAACGGDDLPRDVHSLDGIDLWISDGSSGDDCESAECRYHCVDGLCVQRLPACCLDRSQKAEPGQAPQLMRGVVSLWRRAVHAEPSPVKVRLDP